MKGLAVVLLGVMLSAGLSQSESPRTETRQYVTDPGGLYVVGDIWNIELNDCESHDVGMGLVCVPLDGTESFVTIHVADATGLPVSAVTMDERGFEVHFCGSIGPIPVRPIAFAEVWLEWADFGLCTGAPTAGTVTFAFE